MLHIISDINVAGTASFNHLPHPICNPFFSIDVYATTFAYAPIGVKFPPISVPKEVAHNIMDKAGTPANFTIFCRT